MMKRLIIFFGILCMFFVSGYSYTNISSCQTINSPGEYKLNQSISNYSHIGDWCLVLNVNNIHLDCQDNVVSANKAFILNNENNSLYNCRIENTTGYSVELLGVSKSFIENITFYNISSGIRINSNNNVNLSNLVYLNSIGNNNIDVSGIFVNNLIFDNLENFQLTFDPTTTGPDNVEIKNSNLFSLFFLTSDGERVYDFNIKNNTISTFTMFGNVSNILVENNNVEKISFGTIGSEYPLNNNFTNNIISNLTSVNWAQTPQFFSDNTYDSSLVNSSGCIIGSTYCDPLFSLIVAPPVVSGFVSVASLPSFGFVSVLLSLFLIGGFLI